MNYLKKISGLGRIFYPSLTCKIKTSQKILYLSFDDGPIPEVTSWVLNELQLFNAKAVFFCIGENLQNNPKIAKQILAEGHKMGNHTFSHPKGWETKNSDYLENTLKCEDILKDYSEEKLFRPPYGKIKYSQIKLLEKHGFKIVMWDVISGDFDTTITSENCYQNVVGNCNEGSIVVFHDSIKAFPHLKNILPRVLEFYSNLGYRFETF